MPTYEYHCSTCNKDLEIFQSMKDDALTVCPLCEKKGKIKRMISGGAGLIFKGSGFYETDYKKQPEKKTESKEDKKTESTKSETPKKETKKESSPSSS